MEIPNSWPPASTTMMRDIAMVIGRSSRTLVPAPTRLTSETRPPICSIAARTTSIPMPRPEMSDTADAVENPGEKTRSMTCSSVTRPVHRRTRSAFRKPCAARAAGSMPRPSSLTSTMRRSATRRRPDRNRCRLGFACRPSLTGIFDTMIQRVTDQMHQGFEETVDDGLVGFRGFAARDQRYVLVELAGDIADQSRKATGIPAPPAPSAIADRAVQFGHQPIDGVMCRAGSILRARARQRPARRAWPSAPEHFSRPRVRPPD